MTDTPHWKAMWRSFCHQGAPEAPDPVLLPGRVALLAIHVQNTYPNRPDPATLAPEERARFDAWTPFHARTNGQAIPAIARMLEAFRGRGEAVLFARIACLRPDGADGSLGQKRPGVLGYLPAR